MAGISGEPPAGSHVMRHTCLIPNQTHHHRLSKYYGIFTAIIRLPYIPLLQKKKFIHSFFHFQVSAPTYVK
ncbi:hypothetical protein LDENG_00161060 [Lucifuga dentata]|nr:hypothetical protein LDENG_00161060 [Lucifuga dentata]